jgi:excisionase-like protein
MNERLTTLEAWSHAEYGENAPCIATLRRWVREGKILPKPEKHGRTYYVMPTARYVKNAARSRLMRAIYGTETSQSR